MASGHLFGHVGTLAPDAMLWLNAVGEVPCSLIHIAFCGQDLYEQYFLIVSIS